MKKTDETINWHRPALINININIYKPNFYLFISFYFDEV